MSLYFALVHSHLNYCPIIAGSTSLSNRTKIFKLQKKALRIANKTPYNAHTSPLFEKHKILTYENIIKQHTLHFMHSVHNHYAPPIFDNIWNTNTNRNINYELRNTHDYTLPRIHYSYLKNTPLFSFPSEWNEAQIKFPSVYHNNFYTFQTSLKEELLYSQNLANLAS